MLLAGWVCGTTFLEERLPRANARIYELRKAGYYVDRRRCANPQHSHRTHQWEWTIVAVPDLAEGEPCPDCGGRLGHTSACRYQALVEADGQLFGGVL
jgi:hypothetical protein